MSDHNKPDAEKEGYVKNEMVPNYAQMAWEIIVGLRTMDLDPAIESNLWPIGKPQSNTILNGDSWEDDVNNLRLSIERDVFKSILGEMTEADFLSLSPEESADRLVQIRWRIEGILKNYRTSIYGAEGYARRFSQSNYDANEWQAAAMEMDQSHQIMCGLLARGIEAKKGDKILDLACGTGLSSLPIRENHPEVEIFGVDISGPMLELFCKKGGKNLTRQPVDLTQSVPHLPGQNESFDHIVCNGFLPYVANPGPIFRLIECALKKGGLAHFSIKVPVDQDFNIYPLDGHYFDLESFLSDPELAVYFHPINDIEDALKKLGLQIQYKSEPIRVHTEYYAKLGTYYVYFTVTKP